MQGKSSESAAQFSKGVGGGKLGLCMLHSTSPCEGWGWHLPSGQAAIVTALGCPSDPQGTGTVPCQRGNDHGERETAPCQQGNDHGERETAPCQQGSDHGERETCTVQHISTRQSDTA
jgi:hypothetical protein